MSVKKAYVELVEFLKENQNKKISTIMPEILELVTSKTNSTTFRKDESGQVTHIFCYYHKKWEPVELFGNKKHSTTGYNSMCKEGVNQWSKQQREAKKAEASLLDRVASGELSVDDIQSERDKIEESKNVIVPREDGIGEDE